MLQSASSVSPRKLDCGAKGGTYAGIFIILIIYSRVQQLGKANLDINDPEYGIANLTME
jgi:hypothetical protein